MPPPFRPLTARNRRAVCHRLDRLTSGVLIVAKTKDAARRVGAQIVARDVRKEYVCRVEGPFPE
jgi:tRNA pseudouridine synthase 9